MTKLKTMGLAAALIGGLAVNSLAAAELGMDAPELGVARFIKGPPVRLSDGQGKKAYVVEFWATWCGPCRTSIPHLTKLQKRFEKDVTFIGISDETEAKVRPFVKDMGDKMDYTVAIDDNRNTYGKYMTAFKQGGIPTAFVVDKAGKIVWVGHPMAELDKVLEKVVAGTFDVQAHKAAAAKAAEMEKNMIAYFEAAAKGEPSATDALNGINFVEDADDPQLLNQFAWIILTHAQIKHRDKELALMAAKKAYGRTEGKDPSVTDTYARALFDTGDKTAAVKMQQDAISKTSNPQQKAQMERALQKYQSSQ